MAVDGVHVRMCIKYVCTYVRMYVHKHYLESCISMDSE